jgi:hypothetical protein
MPASSSSIADGGEIGAVPSRTRRWLLNAVALFLLYGNAVAVLQAPALRSFGLPALAPLWLRDTFLLHGMFTSYSRYNCDLFIAGERTHTGTLGDRGSWVPVQLREHFAARHGVTFTQMFATHHWDIYGPRAQRSAWKSLAARIRARHNRLHPERPIARVRFGTEEWPQSPAGYRARKDAAQARIWYEEPARR